MIISLYILRRYFWSFLQVSLFIVTLVFLVDVVDQLARFSAQKIGFGQVVIYCLLRLGDNYLQFLPLIILLSALFCFTGLSKTSEIVILRAAGMPATRFVFIPVAFVFLLGVLTATLFNPIYVAAREMKQNYENQFLGRPEGYIGYSRENGLWLRSHTNGEIQVFRLQNVNWAEERLRGVTIYSYGEDNVKTELISQNAQIVDGKWVLANVQKTEYADKITTSRMPKVEFEATEQFESFFSEFYSARNIRNDKLPGYIAKLERDNYDTKEARSYFYSELAFPVLLMALCLVGSIFALAPERMGGTLRRVMLSIAVGFVVFGLTRLTMSMGVAGTLPVGISVLIIPIPSMLIAIAVLLKQEDG